MEQIHAGKGGNPLGSEPVGSLLMKFAIPSVLSMLIDALYNLADQVFIGRGVGVLGIAATTAAIPFVTIGLSAATLLGIGGSVYASMCMGAGKNGQAEKTLGTVFVLAVSAGVLFTAACLCFLRPLAFAFGATDGSLPYVMDYTSILLLGAPFSMAAVTLSSMARADGSPMLAMGCFLAGTALNLVLDPICIFVLGWGVKGAAAATVTSQVVSAAILVVYFLKKGHMRFKRESIRPDFAVCRRVLALGLPAFLIQAAAALLQIELNKAVVRTGAQGVSSEAALSAIGIVMRVSSVAISVCVGIALGMQPIIGFNQGAGNRQRVRETYRKAVFAATAVSLTGWLGCELFPAQLLRLFGMDDPAYLDFGVRCMRLFLLAMLTGGFQVVTAQYYLACGQAVKAMALSILRPIVFMIPLIHLFSRFWGLEGILYASPAADCMAAAAAAVLIRMEWKTNNQKEMKAHG